MYGPNEFNRYKERILEENGIVLDDYNPYTLISTPRRWGKTTSVAIFIAACLLTVPHIWISVYSTGRRASKALGDLVHKYLVKMEEATHVKKSGVFIKNTEELFYGTVNDLRRLYSYPATVQARGSFLSARTTHAKLLRLSICFRTLTPLYNYQFFSTLLCYLAIRISSTT